MKKQWSQVDLQRRCAWIDAENSKSKKAIAVPLNDNALSVLRSQIGRHEKYVFTYKGEPVTRANNHAWRKALIRAGIDNFRWHDLRHTWASWHVQNVHAAKCSKRIGWMGGFVDGFALRAFEQRTPCKLRE